MERKIDFSLACSFTGHRAIPDESVDKLRKTVSETVDGLIARGIKRFICGGALGFDTLAAQVILEKKKQNDIFLEIAVPCKDQSRRWNKKDREEYERILSCADKTTVLFEKYVTGCMHFRDAYMVDNSDVLIAYYRGKTGGTQYTLLYAENRGIEIIYV